MKDHDEHCFDRYFGFDFDDFCVRSFRNLSKLFYKNKNAKYIKTYKCKACGIKCYFDNIDDDKSIYYFHDNYTVYNNKPIKCTDFQIKKLLE